MNRARVSKLTIEYSVVLSLMQSTQWIFLHIAVQPVQPEQVRQVQQVEGECDMPIKETIQQTVRTGSMDLIECTVRI